MFWHIIAHPLHHVSAIWTILTLGTIAASLRARF